MATAMRVEVDGVEIDPQTCTRSNGWRTAGEIIKQMGGDAVGLPPAPGNSSERAKATPAVTCGGGSCSSRTGAGGEERLCRPPINKGKLLKRARMPELPRDDMKIIVRPRGGLRVGDVTRVRALQGSDGGGADRSRRFKRRRGVSEHPPEHPCNQHTKTGECGPLHIGGVI